MRIRISAAVIAALMSTITSATAAQFDTVGVRALGMGGANVAAVRDSNASYWNPAALGFFGEDSPEYKALDNNGLSNKDFGLGVDVQGGLSVHGTMAESVDTIGKIDFNLVSTAASGGQITNQQTLADSLVLLGQLDKLNEPKSGAIIKVNGLVDARVGSFGLGVHVLGGVATTASIDTTRLSIGGQAGAAGINTALAGGATLGAAPTTTYFSTAQRDALIATLVAQGIPQNQAWASVAQADTALAASPTAAGQQAQITSTINTLASATTGGNLQDNYSSLSFRGLVVAEVPISYGYAFGPSFSIGGSVKLMQGQVLASDIRLFNQSSGNFQSKGNSNPQAQTTFGVDLGMMYRLPAFQIGLLARNLNSPKFSGDVLDENGKPTGATYEHILKPQARVGIAFIPWDTFTLGLDYDLTKNDTVLQDYKSQLVNFGLEWNMMHFLALRAGAYKNLAENDIGTVITAGLGLNLWLARVDVAYAQSTKKVMFNGSEQPAEQKISAAINIDF